MISRRNSLSNSAKKIYIDKNNISEATEIRVENIADAQPISHDDLDDVILSPLRFTDDNVERLDMLECLKEPYLFSSDDLIKICEITPSLKTRIEMINMIGPRLVDPSSKVAAFTGMFRFAEEKNSVEEVLKTRMNAINAAKFSNRNGANALKPGAGRGGAGRGAKMAPATAGRGAGRGIVPAGRGSSRVASLPANLPSSAVGSLSPKVSPKGSSKSPLSSRPLPSTPGGTLVPSSVSTPFATPVPSHSNRNSGIDKQDPEICPEDGAHSPSSLDTDVETIDTWGSGSAFATTTRGVTATAAASTAAAPASKAVPKNNATPSELQDAVRPVPVHVTSTPPPRPLPALPTYSPTTDREEFTHSACSTPNENKKTDPVAAPAAAPVPGTDVGVSVPSQTPSAPAPASITASTVHTMEPPQRRPSAASSLFSSVTEDNTSTPTPSNLHSKNTISENAAANATAGATMTSTTPVPVIMEITARAPQRGPPVASTRHRVNASTGAAAGHSPVPGGAQKSPSITPSPSNTNLQGLGLGQAGQGHGVATLTAAQLALGASTSAVHHSTSTGSNLSRAPTPGIAAQGTTSTPSSSSAATAVVGIHVAPPTVHGSYASQSNLYDLSPMVADCKPEVGVHSLLSKFSGTGGTHSGTNSNSNSGKLAPSTGSSRKITELANALAMKPATSTASSTMVPGFSLNISRGPSRSGSSKNEDFSRPGSGISAAEARSQAPAPIVIPGATLSLAEMRAKFSGGSGGGGGGGGSSSTHSNAVAALLACGSQSAVSSPARPALMRSDSNNGSMSLKEPGTERKIVRRHSESHGNASFIAMLAAANGPVPSSPASSPSSSVASEVAGAGADLATRCATALQMSRAEFTSLRPECAVFTPEVVTETALPQYTYREVVRRNFWKEYDELNQNVLELYVCDEDFSVVFQRNKAEYAKQPRWRQVEQKKKALLF